MNLEVGSKKRSLKARWRHLTCEDQDPRRAAQDQHPDPNIMEQLDSTSMRRSLHEESEHRGVPSIAVDEAHAMSSLTNWSMAK